MNIRKQLALPGLLIVMALITSCIKNEAPNAEADIITASIENEAILQTNPAITNTSVTFRLGAFPGSYEFAPEFTLTPGATIMPAGGTKRNFSEPKKYTITSQDGHWHKTYTVSFIVGDNANYIYSFEDIKVHDTDNPEGHYVQFYDYLPSGQKDFDWASGNPGYNILAATLLDDGQTLTPDFYPTAQGDNGHRGKCAVLQTKSTGALGQMMGSPLAAGNLFIGSFKLTFPAINSTHFGQPYTHRTAPVALTGYFKYKAGEDFKVNNPPSKLTADTWDAYAILFEKRDSANYLSGDHNFQDPRIVSVARLKPSQRVEAGQWTKFKIPFEFVDGNHFDPTQKYMYTIVFSSSLEGAQYNGAEGSTLWIDDVKLVTADK